MPLPAPACPFLPRRGHSGNDSSPPASSFQRAIEVGVAVADGLIQPSLDTAVTDTACTLSWAAVKQPVAHCLDVGGDL